MFYSCLQTRFLHSTHTPSPIPFSTVHWPHSGWPLNLRLLIPIPSAARLALWDQMLMFRALLPLTPRPPAPRSHPTCSVLKKANALHMYKPLPNPRTGILLITYTYPCASIYHPVCICVAGKERGRERCREDWPVSRASLLFGTTIRKWPLISLHQGISQVIIRVVRCD